MKSGVSGLTYGSLLALSLVAIPLAHGQENASVLPKGINRVRWVNVFTMPVSHEYNSGGDRSEIMGALNLTIPAATQAAANADLQNLYDKLNLVEAGLGDQLFQTRIQSKGELSFHQTITAYEHGLTSKIALGLIVPVVNYRALARFEATNESQAQDIIDRKIAPMGAAGEPLAEGLRTFNASLPGQQVFESAIFSSKGYKVPSSSEGTGLGDIEAGVKYKFYSNDVWSTAILTGFRFPTSTLKRDYSDLLSQASGDDQLDFGFQHLNEFALVNNLTLGVANKVTVQFADTQKRPVPAIGQTGLTDLTDPNAYDDVRRDLGEMLDSEISLNQALAGKRLNIYSAYQFSAKSRDTYTGGRNRDYASLQRDTASYSHNAEIGVGVSTIPSVIAKKVAVPLEMKLSYNKTLAGKNTADVSYARFDLYLFF